MSIWAQNPLYNKLLKIKKLNMKRDGSRISTHEHEDILSWAEAREARPVEVRNFDGEKINDRVRFRFPGEEYPDEADLEWDQFFDIFDREQLEFHFEDIADEAMENRNVYQFRPRSY
jgi:hypothetical protein